jgi:hypothetical protein
MSPAVNEAISMRLRFEGELGLSANKIVTSSEI